MNVTCSFAPVGLDQLGAHVPSDAQLSRPTATPHVRQRFPVTGDHFLNMSLAIESYGPLAQESLSVQCTPQAVVNLLRVEKSRRADASRLNVCPLGSSSSSSAAGHLILFAHSKPQYFFKAAERHWKRYTWTILIACLLVFHMFVLICGPKLLWACVLPASCSSMKPLTRWLCIYVIAWLGDLSYGQA